MRSFRLVFFLFKFSLLLFLFFGIFHFILSVFFFHFEFHGFNNILYTLQHLVTQKYCVTLPQIDLFFWFYNFNFSIMPSNGRDTGFLFFVYDQIVQLFQLLPNILWFFVFLSYIIVSITCKLVLNGFKSAITLRTHWTQTCFNKKNCHFQWKFIFQNKWSTRIKNGLK